MTIPEKMSDEVMFDKVKAIQDYLREARIEIESGRFDILMGLSGVNREDAKTAEVKRHLSNAAVDIGLAYQAARPHLQSASPI